MVEFINEETGPVREQKLSTGAVPSNLGQDTLMDERSFTFPLTPHAPSVQPPNLCVGQPVSLLTSTPITLLDGKLPHTLLPQQLCKPNANSQGLTMADTLLTPSLITSPLLPKHTHTHTPWG